MRTALRSVAVVIAGFVAASVVMMIVEWTNGHVLYPALGKAAEGLTDREQVRVLMAKAPVGALLVVIFGWTLGGLAGGWVVARLSPPGATRPAAVLGALLLLAGVANNLMIPPPAWFWAASLVVLVPATLAGARLGRARKTS